MPPFDLGEGRSVFEGACAPGVTAREDFAAANSEAAVEPVCMCGDSLEVVKVANPIPESTITTVMHNTARCLSTNIFL
jgi:hypothetical protein